MSYNGRNLGINYIIKEAGFVGTASKIGDVARALGSVAAFATTAGFATKKLIDKIMNDTRRKAMIEDLMLHDPIISKATEDEVMSYYATIYNVAPTMSLDKNTVRELLQNFIKFGRVDIQTIKMLAEAEGRVSANNTFQIPRLF